MKSLQKIIGVACLFGVLVSAVPAHAQSSDFYEDYIVDRLEVGLRMSYYSFTDSEKVQYDANGNPNGYTLGISTSDLEAQPNYLPLPYVMYKFTPYFGLRAALETLEAKTLTLDKADPHSDGEIDGWGLTLDMIGRWPNETIVTPYVGFGMTLWNLDFEEDSGFYENGRRRIEVDNMVGWVMSGGCTVNIYENWSADLELSYMLAQTDAVFIFQGNQSHEWTFPLDTFYARLGVKYEF